MAGQIPKTKSKAQVLQMKRPHICLKTLMVSYCVLVASICSVLAATCPSSVPSSTTITSEQCTFDLHFGDLKCNFIFSWILRNFSGYSSIEHYGVAGGPVSSSLYYLYRLQSEKKRCYLNLDFMYIQCAQNKRIIKGNESKQRLFNWSN